MNVKEHLSFSIYSTTLVVATAITTLYIELDTFETNITLNLVVGVGVGSLLPDIDHPRSIAGHIIPFHLLHKVFRFAKIFKHGGITHTLLVNMLIIACGYYLNSWLLYGISFGYFTHLYLDHVTGNKLGMLYFPFRRRGQKK